MPKKKTALAGTQDVRKPITDAIPSRRNVVGRQVGYLTFHGDAPNDGETITFTAINGVDYTATVKECTSVDGKIICELSDGPHVAPK